MAVSITSVDSTIGVNPEGWGRRGSWTGVKLILHGKWCVFKKRRQICPKCIRVNGNFLISWEKGQFLELMTKKGHRNFSLKNWNSFEKRKCFRMKQEISVTRSTTSQISNEIDAAGFNRYMYHINLHKQAVN